MSHCERVALLHHNSTIGSHFPELELFTETHLSCLGAILRSFSSWLRALQRKEKLLFGLVNGCNQRHCSSLLKQEVPTDLHSLSLCWIVFLGLLRRWGYDQRSSCSFFWIALTTRRCGGGGGHLQIEAGATGFAVCWVNSPWSDAVLAAKHMGTPTLAETSCPWFQRRSCRST